MNSPINNKQNKVTLLDAQDDALDSYFDALLFADENDLIENKELIIEPVELKSAEAELSITEQVNTVSISSEIVFSEKDKDGKVVNQVLIPRSQRVKTAKIAPRQSAIAKQCRQPDLIHPSSTQAGKMSCSDKEETAVQKMPLKGDISFKESAFKESAEALQQRKNKPSEQKSIEFKEAPELDLSLFLPNIETLSDDKQSLEAVSRISECQVQLESDLARVAKLEQKLQQKIKQQDELNASSGKTSNAPAWAESDFQVLLFTVSGLKLAVPLNELSGILQWGDEYINELPGHASWYLGLIQNQGVNIPVIDTLQQVVPKNRWPEDYIVQRKFKHIILIDNSRWGLACEKVVEVITLKTDAVKWRSSRTKRRWLSGTVIEHMCALLDSSEFSTMLKTGDDSIIGC